MVEDQKTISFYYMLESYYADNRKVKFLITIGMRYFVQFRFLGSGGEGKKYYNMIQDHFDMCTLELK